VSHAWRSRRETECGVNEHAVQGSWGSPSGDYEGENHALQAAAALTYSYRGQDEKMEENGDTEDREEKGMK